MNEPDPHQNPPTKPAPAGMEWIRLRDGARITLDSPIATAPGGWVAVPTRDVHVYQDAGLLI